MNCTEFESILADYIDGTLSQAERAFVEQHAAACAGCREFMADVNGGLGMLNRATEVEPPPELITRIAYLRPMGRTREPFERQGLISRLTSRWLLPLLQPRLAMGMAMTILSFAMLERCTGVRVQRIGAADLSPVRVWGGVEDKALRVKDQVVKYYENLRIVYEIETHLKDLQEPVDAGARPLGASGRTARSQSKAGSSAPTQSQGSFAKPSRDTRSKP